MAGYRAKIKRHEIKLDGPYEGLEAVLRGLTLGEFMNLMGIGEVDLSAVSDQLRAMANALISWNLETEDGTPVPATAESVYAQDQDMMLRLASAWLSAVKGISVPLEQPSTDGDRSLEESLPMEPLSESLAS